MNKIKDAGGKCLPGAQSLTAHPKRRLMINKFGILFRKKKSHEFEKYIVSSL